MRTRSTPFLRRTGLALLVATLVGGTAALTTGPAGAAPGAVSVSNADLQPCGVTPTLLCFSNLNGQKVPTAGTASVVDDTRASSGDGYLRLATPGAADKAVIYQPTPGTTLGQLRSLAYSTMIEQAIEGRPNLAPSYNIEVTSSKISPKDSKVMGFTSLVWEPIYSATPTVTPGTWQRWTPSAAKGWWASSDREVPVGELNRFGFKSYAATFDEVVAGLGPEATVLDVNLNQGSGAGGLVSGADLFQLNDRIVDFENPVSAKAIAKTAGDNQSAAAGTAFPTRLAATVTGGTKKTRPVPNTPV
uniref:hypothetical protein n=1 Tax=Pseudonocardia pini TaxID=2758030 RepID=UPI0015F00FD8